MKWVKKIFFFSIKVSFVFFLGAVLAGISAFVTLKILTMAKKVEVPDLQGKTVEEAKEIADKLSLDLSVERPGVASETIPINRIAWQDPEPGVRVKAGRSIHVRLSVGNQRARMPEVQGLPFRSAMLQLQSEGFRVERVLHIQSFYADKGIVFQYPEAGKMVRAGESIVLVVNDARGPTFIMPNVIGKPLRTVLAFFRKKGYRIGHILYESYPGVPPGRIVKQVPQAGYPVNPSSDVVTFVVSR